MNKDNKEKLLIFAIFGGFLFLVIFRRRSKTFENFGWGKKAWKSTKKRSKKRS